MPRLRMPPAEVAGWIRRYVEGSNNPDFQNYASRSGLPHSPWGRFLWLTRYLMRLGNMQDARVLEVGCGFGWDAVALSLMGDNRVVANDIREEMTSTVIERVAAIRVQGAPVSIETLTADICGIELPPASFDAIISREAIEHVHDLDAMFRVCFSALKPGGRIVIANDCNALNSKEAAGAQVKWVRRDTSWGRIEELKRERPIENRGIKPYAVMREEIARRSNPALTEDAIRAIVASTAGMIQPEIEHVSRSYNGSGPLPTPPRLSWCRNPVSREYCERLLDPFEIREMLRSVGFEAEIRHGFRKFPLVLFNRIGLRPIDELLFQLRAFFVLVGRKPAG